VSFPGGKDSQSPRGRKNWGQRVGTLIKNKRLLGELSLYDRKEGPRKKEGLNCAGRGGRWESFSF